jgi:hypothetical protein
MKMNEPTRMKVYLESTISSYYTARPSADAIKASRQASTIRWHERWAANCDCYISRYVIAENANGDPECAKRRLEYIRDFPVIDSDDRQVTALAERLLKPIGDIPENEKIDAFHIAVAAIYQMDVLLTWNCRHINNPVILPKTISEIALAGYQCPKILTPEEFMEVYDVH